MKKLLICLFLGAAIAPLSPLRAAPAKPQKVTLKWPTFRAVASKKSVPDVTAIQYLLRARGFYHSKPDGVFGAQTAASVRAFQRKNGLKADGVVAAQTFSRLVPMLKRGAKGDAVRALQTLMREPTDEMGEQQSRDFPVDGFFGAGTDGLLRDYQTDWVGNWGGPKIKSDGVAGPQIWCWLLGGQLE